MIVSIHIPKTGGTSFKQSLSKEFGNQLLLDYGKNNSSGSFGLKSQNFLITHPHVRVNQVILNQRAKIIHGHFKADKYQKISRQVKLVTFLREPIDRGASHYFYFQRNPEINVPLARLIRETNLDLKGFYQLEVVRRFYRKILTDSIEIEDFSFIGLTEAYEESLKIFNQMFDVKLEFFCLNQGQGNDYHNLLKDMGIYTEIKESQKENQLIYDLARRKFEKLCQKYL